MKYVRVFVILIFVCALFSCDSRSVEKHKLYGRIVYHTSGDMVNEAKVFLRDITNNIIIDTVLTNSIGYYKFYDVESGFYDVHALKFINPDDSCYTYATPFSETIDFSNEEVTPPVDDLDAYNLNYYGSVRGTVYDSTNAVAEANVLLYIWFDQSFSPYSGTVTDALGNYTLPDVMTGNYYVEVIYNMDSATSQLFFNNGGSVSDIEDLFLN